MEPIYILGILVSVHKKYEVDTHILCGLQLLQQTSPVNEICIDCCTFYLSEPAFQSPEPLNLELCSKELVIGVPSKVTDTNLNLSDLVLVAPELIKLQC